MTRLAPLLVAFLFSTACVVEQHCYADKDCLGGQACRAGACVAPPDAAPDSWMPDAGLPDAAPDSGMPDAGLPDAAPDEGAQDARPDLQPPDVTTAADASVEGGPDA